MDIWHPRFYPPPCFAQIQPMRKYRGGVFRAVSFHKRGVCARGGGGAHTRRVGGVPELGVVSGPPRGPSEEEASGGGARSTAATSWKQAPL